MANWKLNLYHMMPPFARNWVASMHGYYLRSWRYGEDTEQFIEEALERDKWSIERRNDYQEDHLSRILHRARTQVPYYRDMWATRRKRGDNASWEYLENWPILSKEALRANPIAFIPDDCDLNKLYVDNTSGTTGTPLKLYLSRAMNHHWYALFEARWRRWYGLSRYENWAIVGGQPVVPTHTKRPPYWIWNSALNQLYLSANHISAQNAEAYLDALQCYEITHIVAYTSSITYLAQQLQARGANAKLSKLKAIVTNAEPVFEWQRSILEPVFGCPVYETYGMGEMVTAASADNKGRLRLWPEPGYLEVLDDDNDERVGVGTIGRLVATSLMNECMPLIRYQIGDRSGLSSEEIHESDPIQHPILLPIQGRSSDMLITEDGRRVFWLNPIFYELPVVEAQIQQDRIGEVIIRYVPATWFEDKTLGEIEKRLIGKMGNVTVNFEKMEKIPRGASGKFRPVICNVKTEVKADSVNAHE